MQLPLGIELYVVTFCQKYRLKNYDYCNFLFFSFLSYIISKMIECYGARSFYLLSAMGQSVFCIFVYHESITF